MEIINIIEELYSGSLSIHKKVNLINATVFVNGKMLGLAAQELLAFYSDETPTTVFSDKEIQEIERYFHLIPTEISRTQNHFNC